MDTSLRTQVTDLDSDEEDSTPRTIWVGPAACDSKRDRRTEIQLKVWQELSRNSHMAFAHPIIGSAVDLFRESLSCYQNGAFMASTLMCRTVTETPFTWPFRGSLHRNNILWKSGSTFEILEIGARSEPKPSIWASLQKTT